MWQKGLMKSSGGGGGDVTIEYVGQFTSGKGATTAKSIDFKTGDYARADYAELTADNFIVLPVRSSSNYSLESARGIGNTAYWCSKTTIGNKLHDYTPSTGILKFYGGVSTEAGTYNAASGGTYTQRYTGTGNMNYKVYITKPPISSFE